MPISPVASRTHPSSKPVFGGHEKFVLRHGWLKKGVDAIAQDPLAFAEESALVTLGVGKNMVRSIRHWCLATRVAEEGVADRRGLSVTPIGRHLLDDRGWDPFLEDPASLWLVHWLLCANQLRALVWSLIFSRFFETEFTKHALTAFAGRHVERMGVNTTLGTIQREVDAFLRTYVLSQRGRGADVQEETLDCPLTELDLIRYNAEDGVYLFHQGPKPALPAALFGYCLLDYSQRAARSRRTLGVDECLNGEGSPGVICRLDENSVVEYLEQLGDLTAGQVQFAETAGLRQVFFDLPHDDSLPTLQYALLNDYYDDAR